MTAATPATRACNRHRQVGRVTQAKTGGGLVDGVLVRAPIKPRLRSKESSAKEAKESPKKVRSISPKEPNMKLVK